MPASRTLAALGAILFLAACSNVQLVENARTTVNDHYGVDPQGQWNEVEGNNAVVWTRNGILLDRLNFYNPIDDGEPMVEENDDEAAPKFNSAMLESEIQDFVIGSMVYTKAEDPRASGLRPFDFGGHNGFRFEVDWFNKGLARRASVAGAVVESKLYLMLLDAPAQHYYGVTLPLYDRMLSSLVLDS